jgi:hypothetical protein
MPRPSLRFLGLVAAAFSVGCGSGVSLENLRCDGACQSVADPLTMTLAVDYLDEDGRLSEGSLEVKLDDAALASIPVASLGAGPLEASGTLRFRVPLRFRSLQNGRTFTLGVSTKSDAGDSNEVESAFVLNL